MLGFGCPDQRLAEIGMSDGNKRFCPLPGRLSHQFCHAVFRYNGRGDSPCRRDDITMREIRLYTGMDNALPIRVGRRHGQKSLTMGRPEGTINKINLTSRTADMPEAG